jgi:hypothetical protein
VSIRSTGVPVVHGSTHELPQVVDRWLAEHHEGLVCVIGAPELASSARLGRCRPGGEGARVRPGRGRGEPGRDRIQDVVDRYVAMTRATQQLVLLRP